MFSFPRRNFTGDELNYFELSRGINHGLYEVPSLSVRIPFLVYRLRHDDKLVFTDVDGTITEEDVAGRVFPAFGFKVFEFELKFRKQHFLGGQSVSINFLF